MHKDIARQAQLYMHLESLRLLAFHTVKHIHSLIHITLELTYLMTYHLCQSQLLNQIQCLYEMVYSHEMKNNTLL